MSAPDPFDLARFVDAQDRGQSYERALAELRDGRKLGHWIWWVFPQLVGLGQSETSRVYGIASLPEARAYLAHPVLGPRLREAASALLAHGGRSAREILGGDDIKLRSCATLFLRADPVDPLFRNVIATFFNDVPDPLTDRLLGTSSP